MRLIDRILDYKDTAYLIAYYEESRSYYVDMHLRYFHDKISDRVAKKMDFELMIDGLYL
jgi:hypothetical protein